MPAFAYMNGEQVWVNWWEGSGTNSTYQVWPVWVQGTAGTYPITSTIVNSSDTVTFNTAYVNWVTIAFDGSGTIQTITPHPTAPEEVDLDENDGWMREWAQHGRNAHYVLNRIFGSYDRYLSNKKAERFMLKYLTDEQKEDYAKFGSFNVRTLRGERYRIRKEYAGNVDKLDKDGRVCAVYCAHPTGGVPVCDVMLAQKLMLEHDEESFLNVANRHR